MLIRNFFRDVISTLPRLMSVIIITALGVVLLVGMGEYNYNLTKIGERYYASQNVADYWIQGSKLSKLDEMKIAKLDSVESTQSEINIQTEIFSDKNINIDLQGISGDFIIDKPYIVSGRMFESNRECMLDASYAKVHNISVNDKIQLRIKDTESKLSFTVCALIDSPEYIKNTGATDLVPDSNKHGFAYVKEDALEDMKALLGYNTITLKIKDNADKNQFKIGVEKILGTKLMRLTEFNDNEKAHIIITKSNNTKAVTVVMPMIFFIIAAFIMFTTMSRVVENGRMMIGTLKAFGYSKLKIYTYFLSYAFIVVILGNLIGIFLSGYLASGLMRLLLSSLTLPEFSLNIDYLSIFKSIVLTTVICVGTAAVVCASEIKNSPTECMRPKSPKAAKVNILERIKFLWSIMNFAQKTVTRNIFRNKARMFMCVFGVAGCMAITLAGFGLRDSINATTSSLFTNMYKYDVNVIFKNDVTLNEAARISKLTGVDKAENVMMVPIRIIKDRKSVDATANILKDKVTLMLPSLKLQDSMTMPEDGLILSSTLAEDLNLKKGDIINIIVAGNTDIIKVKVSESKDNISGCYLSKSVWRKLGQEYKPSGVYVKTKDVKSFVAKTKEYDFVSTAILESKVVDSTNSETSVLNTVTVVFIFFGGVLGLVVLYNLGILNYFERMRELATLKVLGFIPREIKGLVLTENIIFTIIGIALGIPLGIALTSFLVAKSPQKSMTFLTNIKLTSFIYSIGLTMMFSLFVNWILGKKLNKIDMLGSLKSVE